MFVIVQMTVACMGMVASMGVCVRSTSIPRHAGSVEYVRQTCKDYVIPLRHSLPSGERDDKEAANVQSNILMTAYGCWKREERKRRR